MRKRNLLCSAVLSTMLVTNALPCTVFAEEVPADANTEITAEVTDGDVETQESENADADSESTDTEALIADSQDTNTEEAGTDSDTENQDMSNNDTTADHNTDASSNGEHAPKDTGNSENSENRGNRGQDDKGSSQTTTTSSVQTVERFNYDINATFTIFRHALTDISLTSDTSGKNNNYTSKALAGIADKLRNGSEVDVISGATLSSNAIIAALSQAGDYDSVSENLTASLNGTAVSSSQSEQSGSGQSGKGQSGSQDKGQETAKTVPANYITYTVADSSDGHKVVLFQLSEDAQNDNTYVNMALLVDENGKHFMPVDAGSDETGNGNDYFSYHSDDSSFTILNDDLTSIEVIFTSAEYGKVHFTVDLTAATGGNEEGSGAKEDDPKGDNDKENEGSETGNEGTADSETDKGGTTDSETDRNDTTDSETDKGGTAGSETGTKDTDNIGQKETAAENTTINTAEKISVSDTQSKIEKTSADTVSTKTTTNSTNSNTTASTSTSDTVKTGDNHSLILIPALAFIAAMGILVNTFRRLRKTM